MFNMKLQENSYKISFKALLVKIQQSKTNKKDSVCVPIAMQIKLSLVFEIDQNTTFSIPLYCA